MVMRRYTIRCFPATRGTAWAARGIKPLRAAIEAIGGQVHETFIAGPVLYADVSLTPDQRQTVAGYPMVQDIHLQGLQTD